MSLVCRPLAQWPASASIGGKAKGLSLARQAGVRIPPTWVAGEVEGPEEATIRSHVYAALPTLAEAVCSELQTAGITQVAVRSSAQVEDGSFVSFAGQWQTAVRVPVRVDALVPALEQVFRAVENPALREYAAHFDIQLDQMRLSALIQPWVEAQVSGVAFSLNPLTGEDRILVEATPGTAEALMDGRACGQRFHLTQTGAELENATEAVLLSDEACVSLRKTILTLEQAAGWPVDVEWALDAAGIVVLQVRPVTAFETPPSREVAWSRELTAERYPLPLSPLGWTNIKAVFEEGVRGFAAFMGMPLAIRTELAAIDDGWVMANPEAFDFRRRFRVRLEPGEIVALVKTVSARVSRDLWRDGLAEVLRQMRALVRCLKHPDQARTRLGNRAGTLTHLVTGTALLSYLRRVSGQIKSEWPRIRQRFCDEIGAIEAQIMMTRSHFKTS